MVVRQQYGYFLYYFDDNESKRNEIRLRLERNMKKECKEHNIDYSQGNVDYIFKMVEGKKHLWTGAWKVTL